MYEQYGQYAPVQTYLNYPCPMGRCMYYSQPFYQYGQTYPYHVNQYNYQSYPHIYPNYYDEQIPIQNQNISEDNALNATQVMNNVNNDVAFSHQFLNEHGQVDVNKMLTTVGQLAQTVQQVSPVIKQVNDIIQSFRA